MDTYDKGMHHIEANAQLWSSRCTHSAHNILSWKISHLKKSDSEWSLRSCTNIDFASLPNLWLCLVTQEIYLSEQKKRIAISKNANLFRTSMIHAWKENGVWSQQLDTFFGQVGVSGYFACMYSVLDITHSGPQQKCLKGVFGRSDC